MNKSKNPIESLNEFQFQNNRLNNILDRQVDKILESDNIDYIKKELIQLKKMVLLLF